MFPMKDIRDNKDDVYHDQYGMQHVTCTSGG
jgi:hypothetical protein